MTLRSRVPAAASVRIAAALLAASLAGPGACRGGPAEEDPAEARARLEARVESLRERVEARLAADTLLREIASDTAHILVGLRTPLLEAIVAGATIAYLGDVRLHLEPRLVIRESEDVRVSLGPVGIRAGEWRVRVEIQRIEATLSAEAVELTVVDSARLGLRIPVRVRDGAGRARIDFEWDASAATSVVCRSFEITETFAGVVAPREYEVRGGFLLEAEAADVVARPYQTGPRLQVRPEPTAASWARLREILDRQNHIFRCGLALSPEGMEATLRELLRRGFRFSLPDVILRPIPLPASFSDEVSVQGRDFLLELRPVTLRLTPGALWYGVAVQVEG